MKILNTEEFAKLPEGVLFSEYIQCSLSALCIKGETTNFDSDTKWVQFWDASVNDILANDCNTIEFLKPGDSSPLDIAYTRNVHPPERMFAVWELDDLQKLAEIVNNAIEVTEL